MSPTEQVETVVVGGGQAGLVTGYHLAERGRDFVILDAHQRIGDAWRKRWDSLRLFTPARYNGLEGWPFPARGTTFPTKDEMAEYLEAYADRFRLPVRTGVRVDSLSRNGSRYVVKANSQRFEAHNIVVAAGSHQIPRVPDFAPELDSSIRQVHSSAYRSPSELADGAVLVVGLGNSGAEITYEVAQTHPAFLSGRPSAQIPFRHGPAMARTVLPVIRFLGHHVLTMRTPLGRKVGPKFVKQAAPLIRVKLKHLAAAGVEQVPRVVGVSDGRPLLEDGRTLEVANVIWCTGFREEFPWIELPIFGEGGRPVHERGVVPGQPGLYFVGLLFQYAATSDVLPGVGRDAAYVADRIAARERDGAGVEAAVTGGRSER